MLLGCQRGDMARGEGFRFNNVTLGRTLHSQIITRRLDAYISNSTSLDIQLCRASKIHGITTGIKRRKRMI